jgi:peptide/nickel transport system substrate-binding protein
LSSARSRIGLLAAVITGVLVLAACSGSSSGNDDQAKVTATPAPITMAYAHEQEFTSYNNNTEDQAAVANAVVLNQILRGFWYADPQGQVHPDTEFGTYARVTGNPLTIRYTFNPKARWSDGSPIDCDDAVLAWAANSGRWPTGKRDPDTDAKLTAFSSIRPGAWANANPPKCNAGDRSFTITFNTVYADWDSLFGPGTILPAHIVEKESGVADIVAAVKANRTATMIKVGNIYNHLWNFRPGQYRTDVSPSAGPYQVASWKAGQSITLAPNPQWWGTPAKAATLVIRFIPEDQQVSALRAGKVQVIDPDPSTELLAQLSQNPAGSAPLKVSTHDSFTWEHLDFNFAGEFKSKELRQAFADCVPRQQILDNLIKPLNPNAQVLQSRFVLPFQSGYSTFTSIGGQAYNTVNVAAAKRILQTSHKVGTKVRISYQTPNPRRQAEVALIRASCDQAGFKVEDAGTDRFFGGALDLGTFDVALFAWTNSQLVTQNYATYITKGVQNKGHYSNPQVDLLLKQLYSEINPINQQRIEQKLDQALWGDLATEPLFAFPALVATAGNVRGVNYNPSGYDITYNANNWSTTP